MAFQVNRLGDVGPAGSLKADRRLYLTADRARVVDENDPDAAFLLAAVGRVISVREATRLSLSIKDGKIVQGREIVEGKLDAKPEDKMGARPENKGARAPAADPPDATQAKG